MGNNIKIENLDAIYNSGLKEFTEDFLREKAVKRQNIVYSIGGQIVKLSADNVRWLYNKLRAGLEGWEVTYLRNVAAEGRNMTYYFDGQTLEIPATVVLDLFDRLNSNKG